MGVIHRFWVGPPGAHDYEEDLARLNPGVPVRTWTPETAPAHWVDLAAATAGTVPEDQQARHLANVVRLGVLFEYGGWWADHDLQPLVPFSSLPFPATAAHRGGARCNCWLAFAAHDRHLEVALAAVGEDGGTSYSASGERLLGRVLPASVPGVLLWRDVNGRVNEGAERWAVHVHASSATRGLTAPPVATRVRV